MEFIKYSPFTSPPPQKRKKKKALLYTALCSSSSKPSFMWLLQTLDIYNMIFTGIGM